jgi:cell division protein FtsB
MIKEGKELNDVVCAAYRMGCEQTREVYQKRVKDLEVGEEEWNRICNSYAAENQRLSDRIVKLEEALRDLSTGWDCCAVSKAMKLIARKALEGKDE